METKIGFRDFPLTVRGFAIALDQILPNWYSRVNTEELYMGSQTTCLVGQITRGMYEGPTGFLMKHFNVGYVWYFDGSPVGFTSGYRKESNGRNPEEYKKDWRVDPLRLDWIAEIAARRMK